MLLIQFEFACRLNIHFVDNLGACSQLAVGSKSP